MADGTPNILAVEVFLNSTHCLSRQKVNPNSFPSQAELLDLNIASRAPLCRKPFKSREWKREQRRLGDSNLSETNGMLAAPDQTAEIYGNQKDAGVSVNRISQSERRQSHTDRQNCSASCAVWHLGEVSERATSTSRLTDKQGGGSGMLESRTRMQWATVKTHGIFRDEERPLRLECLVYWAGTIAC